MSVLLALAASTPYGAVRYLRVRPSDREMGEGVRATFEGFAFRPSPYLAKEPRR